MDPILSKLYWTPALPNRYVGEDDQGLKYLVPVVPLGPEAWAKRSPYRGNYTLREAVPQEQLVRLYRGTELMGTTEVARYLGWDRRKVAVYRQRGKLPAPVAKLAAGPIWRREDIETYRRTLGAEG